MRYYQSVYRLIMSEDSLFCSAMAWKHDMLITIKRRLDWINTAAERIFTCDWLPIGSSRSDPCSLSLEAADICNHKEDL